MAEPTSTGAKLKSSWKHVSAHGGQTSVNKQFNCSSPWHRYDIVCCRCSTFAFLFLLFVFFSNWWRWLPDAPSPRQPSSFLPWKGFADGASKIPMCWCLVGRILVPATFCKQSAASFHWKMSTAKCRTQQAYSVHAVWVSLLFFMGDCFLLHFIHVTGANQHHTFTHLGHQWLTLLGCAGPFLLLCLC